MTISNKEESSVPGSESASLLRKTVATPPEPEMRLNKCWDSSRRIQVDILAGLFGISAWLSVNGLFTQLPLLVQSAPEGWNLPSYLAILIQTANLGPLLYGGFLRSHPELLSDRKLIYFVLTLGTSALIWMAFFYDHTLFVIGKERSVFMFMLTFCIALVGCTSSVLFIPFMNNYPEVYLISYMVGEGLSGLVPSIISLVQGVGGNPTCHNVTQPDGTTVLVHSTPEPLFSTQVFFVIMFSIMTVSTISFFLLNNLSICKEQKVRKPLPIISSPNNPKTVTTAMYRILLFIQGVVCLFANGVLPSVQSYSCLPYGNVAYHLAVNLSNMANPLAVFLMFFIPAATNPLVIFFLLLLSGTSVSYLLTLGLMSPNPPLQTSNLGVLLVVLGWVACSGFIAYIKMSIASIFRQEGGQGLYRYGAVTQVGSFIGAISMFSLINFTNLFNSYNPCR